LASALHGLGERIETGADRAVDHLAADLDDQPAENFGIDRSLELDRLAARAASFSVSAAICASSRDARW
jgi:hypothetical protein